MPQRRRTVAELEALLAERERGLAEARAQQDASAEILRAMRGSPAARPAVLDAIPEAAARVCRAATYGALMLLEGPQLRVVADWNPPERGSSVGEVRPLDPRAGAHGMALVERRTVYVPNLAAVPEDELRHTTARRAGVRSVAAAPLWREGEPIGALIVSSQRADALSPRDLRQLESFADQAVIAIENARLFSALRERLAEQTATGGVLRAISTSPTDAGAVLQLIVDTVGALLPGLATVTFYGLVDGRLRLDARWVAPEAVPVIERLSADFAQARLGHIRALPPGTVEAGAVERGVTVHVPDLDALPPGPHPVLRSAGLRTAAGIPLRQGGRVLGVLQVTAFAPHSLTDRQVNLLESFADQAVIAIENTRLFADLQDANRRLEDASRHKSAFLAAMSHELRTPLNAIMGYAEMLREVAQEEGAELYLGDLEKIHGAGQHLLSLINAVLDLSKIEAGKMELDLEEFALADLIAEVRAVAAPLVERNGNALVAECPADAGGMRADRTKLRQAVLNLLSNAAKFTERGTVTLRVGRAGDWISLAVSDTGIGMTDEQVGRLFQEFSQAEAGTSRTYGGTGLGLALSRRFCRLMGGDIAVESALGRGSTFSIRLPVRVAEPPVPITAI